MNKFYNLIGMAKKAGKVSVGYNKCEEAILGNRASLVITSEELSQNSLKKFKNSCEKYNVKMISNASGEELSRMLGNDRIIKVVSIDNKGFSRKLWELWEENSKCGGDHIDKN
ncbi:ribosomal L7Ae/L30e/S12e/Gadd45 family protein [Oceanirhabdus sp. W0125-5]|uniref:ribosomal L7Ae/L30e/S12e/Gadd45 family protein n=1 Tax=Oceanirhabdus sp. W0125-5 TaxID=2999116 RepID=UPI0022F34354|nr:ribosomal L7Ae/L30e/S12e/Gadd45 family protein [Oceanirhabdus sp. W0125-5]WBW94833.1 ribosomal L7Ae/L30e/S12e/Gadd45 family protein [Oceanirhabdus sp. W0125-5]